MRVDRRQLVRWTRFLRPNFKLPSAWSQHGGNFDPARAYLHLLQLEAACADAAEHAYDLRLRSGSVDTEDEDVAIEKFNRHALDVAVRSGAWGLSLDPSRPCRTTASIAKNGILAKTRSDLASLLLVGKRLPLQTDLWRLCLHYALPLKDFGYRIFRLQVSLIRDDRVFVCIDGSYPFDTDDD